LRIRELDKESLREDLWSDPNRARDILQEQSRLKDAVTNWRRLRSHLDDLGLLHQMALDEHDANAQQDVENDIEALDTAVRSDELKMMLASEQDAMNSIVSIHAGAGGTEAQDWAEMLLRMYLRWAERRGFSATVIWGTRLTSW